MAARQAMTIRRAVPADLGAIRSIYNDAVLNTDATLDLVPKSEDEMSAWFDGHDDLHPVFVAEDSGETLGYGALSVFAARGGYRVGAEISLYVAAAHRGRRVGSTMCTHLTDHADAVGLVSVTALVTASNCTSRRLFEGAGYGHHGCLARIGMKFGRIIDLEIYQWIRAEDQQAHATVPEEVPA